MNRSARWTWAVAAVAVFGVVLVLAFVLALTDRDSGLEQHFVWLFWLNVAVAALLCLVVGVAVVRLLQRLHQGRFGARLLVKLAGIFALVGLMPGLAIYAVSYQFVGRSIDGWFDARLAGALDAGLALAKDSLDAQVAQLATRTLQAAETLVDQPGAVTALALERQRVRLGAQELALVDARGQVRLSTAADPAAMLPEPPTSAALRQARSAGVSTQIEGLDEGAGGAAPGAGARVRALAMLPSARITLTESQDRFLLAVQALPPAMAANALAVQAAYTDYQQRALARGSLRRAYIGTLTLGLVLSVFGAVLLAVLLGNQLARPLLLLADGVRQVAAGDLAPKPVFQSSDELGGLTRSFADMTAQLADARSAVQRGVAQLESTRTRLQTILDNLSAGVVLFDRDDRIDTVNPGATRILRLPLSVYRGQELQQVPGLAEFATAVQQRFARYAAGPEAGERDHWQEAYELNLPGRDALMLLVRGAMLPGDARLLVFDDITEVVSAQRTAAWSEVARRLAHEIKNPLTPIQLSAERLQHKLQGKLEGADDALLARSVATIVAQVQAMKRLVDEFRDYARLPAAQLVALDLNALVAEVLALYGQEQEQGRLQLVLAADELPAVQGDPTQLRQVVLNLVQNALDAVADRADGRVRVSTALIRRADGAPAAVRLAVSDNGPGFGARVLARAFEPYVTTKTKGTGLGLAVVKKIADEHRATLRIVNLQDEPGADPEQTGARVSLSFACPDGAAAAAVADVAPAARQGSTPAG